ncbi:MAG: response regulator [Deltaproteobacteria bacterium]|jgi:putative nucleotidyltransferase with HDIG domain|nr:response regulator [Deltaproteobacteria bacterium]
MRVLIVEDDIALGRLLREFLQRLNHEKVQVCATGREAGRVIESETFDCAFVDLRLPDSDGLQLLDTFKSKDPCLPVVMMSGYPTMEYTIEAMRKGASDFLTKPFTLQDVALALERVTKERKLLLENLALQLEIQARKELELVNRELEEKVMEQVKLFEISRAIDEIRSSEELYPSIVKLASKLTNLKKASFFIFPPDQSRLILMADYGTSVDGCVPGLFTMEDEYLRKMIDQHESHVIVSSDNLRTDRSLLNGCCADSVSLSCWPLRIRGELFGFLMGYHNGSGATLSAMETKLLDFLIKKASLAVENMALYESLIGNFYGILRSLVNALEAKDLYTGKHSERVTHYAGMIARRMGCSEAQLETLQTVGYLHDIGKIGIHDSILNKPAPLSREEYELVKKHPVIGESIVAELGLTLEERSIIRHHHERWDGGGYPDGLAGDEIPILARIVAVADAFDAMTSKRAYRGAMGKAEAVRELKKNRQKQFDGDALDAFVEVIEK